MKKLFVGMLLAVNAFAADPGVLISKVSGGGYTAPEYSNYERCDVSANKVVIEHTYGATGPGALKVVEERAITIDGDLAQVIENARLEKVTEKPNNLCDGPSTSIGAQSGDQTIELFSTGGCGTPSQQRNGVYSSKLRSIIDMYCPLTYRPIGVR